MADLSVDAPRDDLVRHVQFTQARADDAADGLTLTGHGAVFNEWTEINSWEGRFKERIAPGAFRKTLKESAGKVRLQFDHGTHPLIGSLPIGAIRSLSEDERGLLVEARLHDNWLVQPVRDAIAEGSIDGMSFRFSVEKERWEKLDSDVPERTITEVRLYEVGPVVFPAYEQTDVGVRSAELARALRSADDDTRREIARALLAPEDEPTENVAPDAAPDEAALEGDPSPENAPASDDLDTPDDGAAADGSTPADEGAVAPTDEPRNAPDGDALAPTYQRAERKRDRAADLAFLAAAIAAGDSHRSTTNHG